MKKPKILEFFLTGLLVIKKEIVDSLGYSLDSSSENDKNEVPKESNIDINEISEEDEEYENYFEFSDEYFCWNISTS